MNVLLGCLNPTASSVCSENILDQPSQLFIFHSGNTTKFKVQHSRKLWWENLKHWQIDGQLPKFSLSNLHTVNRKRFAGLKFHIFFVVFKSTVKVFS